MAVFSIRCSVSRRAALQVAGEAGTVPYVTNGRPRAVTRRFSCLIIAQGAFVHKLGGSSLGGRAGYAEMRGGDTEGRGGEREREIEVEIEIERGAGWRRRPVGEGGRGWPRVLGSERGGSHKGERNCGFGSPPSVFSVPSVPSAAPVVQRLTIRRPAPGSAPPGGPGHWPGCGPGGRGSGAAPRRGRRGPVRACGAPVCRRVEPPRSGSANR